MYCNRCALRRRGMEEIMTQQLIGNQKEPGCPSPVQGHLGKCLWFSKENLNQTSRVLQHHWQGPVRSTLFLSSVLVRMSSGKLCLSRTSARSTVSQNGFCLASKLPEECLDRTRRRQAWCKSLFLTSLKSVWLLFEVNLCSSFYGKASALRPDSYNFGLYVKLKLLIAQTPFVFSLQQLFRSSRKSREERNAFQEWGDGLEAIPQERKASGQQAEMGRLCRQLLYHGSVHRWSQPQVYPVLRLHSLLCAPADDQDGDGCVQTASRT